jgi:hypothetical protein
MVMCVQVVVVCVCMCVYRWTGGVCVHVCVCVHICVCVQVVVCVCVYTGGDAVCVGCR